VELHGGTVQAESDGDGSGATFTVTLPRPQGQQAPEPTQEEGPTSAPGQLPQVVLPDLAGLDVLVVDDEADARQLLAQILQECNARVRLAGGALEALVQARLATPDVLVSDIGMPGEDGYSLIRRLRERPPEQGGTVPAVALTAYVREDDRNRMLAAGFQAHVAKPVEAGDLVTAVGRLAGRAVQSAEEPSAVPSPSGRGIG
jgi:CheY-like chemotaxis protein